MEIRLSFIRVPFTEISDIFALFMEIGIPYKLSFMEITVPNFCIFAGPGRTRAWPPLRLGTGNGPRLGA